MRTVRTKIYKFEELSESAQQTAIENHRNQIDNYFIYDDAHASVKAFHEVFETEEDGRTRLEINASKLGSDILELTGFRLQKYLWNNYGSDLYTGKYYSLWSKKDISFEHHKNGYPVLKSRRSKVLKENCCVLTGVCYDLSLLNPIYEFLEGGEKKDSFKYLTFEMLLNDCFESLEKDIESEIEARQSDEYLIEDLEEQDLEFTENGNIF